MNNGRVERAKVVEDLQHFSEHARDLERGHAPMLELTLQRPTVEVLLHDVEPNRLAARQLEVVENLRDAWVVEPGQQLGLALEQLDLFEVLRCTKQQLLDDDVDPREFVAGVIGSATRALAEHVEEAIPSVQARLSTALRTSVIGLA